LQETDRLFKCEFCRVNSYLQSKDFFRYVLPDQTPDHQQLVFFPYWRFKGMLFSAYPDNIQHRYIDISIQAIQNDLFPFTLGVRSQALKLKFAKHGINGRYLQHSVPRKGIKEIINQRYKPANPKHLAHQTYVGETVSIIYAPFYADKYIFDAVLNEPITPALLDDFSLYALPDARPNWSIQFLPTLCPHCGWDLNGQPDSLMLNCENCASVYQPGEKGFTKLRTAYLPDSADNLVYFPFWRIKSNISGIKLSSYADLVREANLPKAIQPGMDNLLFHYWSPAFKVRPQQFLRISRGITLSQPMEDLTPGLPAEKLHPVTLPLEEGLEGQKMIIASFLKPRIKVAEIVPIMKIVPESYLLVYLPFREKHHELVQPRFTMAINKNMLSHAKHL
jgi:hypothetical protein